MVYIRLTGGAITKYYVAFAKVFIQIILGVNECFPVLGRAQYVLKYTGLAAEQIANTVIKIWEI